MGVWYRTSAVASWTSHSVWLTTKIDQFGHELGGTSREVKWPRDEWISARVQEIDSGCWAWVILVNRTIIERGESTNEHGARAAVRRRVDKLIRKRKKDHHHPDEEVPPRLEQTQNKEPSYYTHPAKGVNVKREGPLPKRYACVHCGWWGFRDTKPSTCPECDRPMEGT